MASSRLQISAGGTEYEKKSQSLASGQAASAAGMVGGCDVGLDSWWNRVPHTEPEGSALKEDSIGALGMLDN